MPTEARNGVYNVRNGRTQKKCKQKLSVKKKQQQKKAIKF